MLRAIDQYFLEKEDPLKSYLLALRAILLAYDEHITETWKYKLPFYVYKGKMLCYLWIHKKYKKPYIGIVEGIKVNHPDLLLENRKRIKILLLDINEDIPVKKIKIILKEVLKFYK